MDLKINNLGNIFNINSGFIQLIFKSEEGIIEHSVITVDELYIIMAKRSGHMGEEWELANQLEMESALKK